MCFSLNSNNEKTVFILAHTEWKANEKKRPNERNVVTLLNAVHRNAQGKKE